jgi:hypothetical protein
MRGSRRPSCQRRLVSCASRARFTPPMAWALRTLSDAIARWVACAGGVRSPPGGCFCGWPLVVPWRRQPWTPIACERPLPCGQGSPGRAATLVAWAFPSDVALTQQRCQLSARTRRCVRVWHVCVPLESSGWAAGAVGRWRGRSGPSGPQGAAEEHRPVVWPRAAPRHPRRGGPEAAVGVLRREARRQAGDAAMDSRVMGTPQSGVLARLAWDAPAHPSA